MESCIGEATQLSAIAAKVPGLSLRCVDGKLLVDLLGHFFLDLFSSESEPLSKSPSVGLLPSVDLELLFFETHGSWSRTAFGLKGYTPHVLKPLIMLAGIIIFNHAFENSELNWYIVITLPA